MTAPNAKINTSIPDAVELSQDLAADRAEGGYVTPGSGLNINATWAIGKIAGLVYEAPGAVNLAVTAGGSAGQSVINAVALNNSGAIDVTAGTSAASPVAPTLDANHVLLALVTVAYGATGVTQANIQNTARNFI